MMNTQKVAITMPQILINELDKILKIKELSRSRYITQAVREKVGEEKNFYNGML